MTLAAAPRRMRFLFAMFEGGGNISLILPIVARLVERGHDVRVLAGPNVRASRQPMSDRFLRRIGATGAEPIALKTPAIHPFDAASFRGLFGGWTPNWLERLTANCAPLVWSRTWAVAVRDELERGPADAIAADFILLGALVAAEAAGIPAAALVHGTWKHRPASGASPYGTGLLPSRSLLGRLRAAPYNAMIRWRYWRDGLPPLALARRELGLPPLRSPFKQYDKIARVLILTSDSFDIPPTPLPANLRYVGTPLERSRETPWRSPWPADDPRPMVLVSLSTLPQGQASMMERILAAVGTLPVRTLVTLGPSLDRSRFTPPPNTVLEAFIPHDAVLPLASAMVTQCGLGTVSKAISAGVPLVCTPLIADQPGIAALVSAQGAGIHLPPSASPKQIALAIERVLRQPNFRDAAAKLATRLANEDGALNAAVELEQLAAARGPPSAGPARAAAFS